MFTIVTAPNSVLSEIAKPISRVDASVVKIIEEMKKTLEKTVDPIGVGLAAPQIGKSLRIFIAKPTDDSKILVFINPFITQIDTDLKQTRTDENQRKSSPKSAKISNKKKLEGCLSLPNIWGPVLRSSSITLSFLDEKGEHHEQKFTDFLATIIQHETDHLNGVLFPKRVLEQKGILYKSHKDEKNEDEFEEIEI